jgi:hypothetical protein
VLGLSSRSELKLRWRRLSEETSRLRSRHRSRDGVIVTGNTLSFRVPLAVEERTGLPWSLMASFLTNRIRRGKVATFFSLDRSSISSGQPSSTSFLSKPPANLAI